jgi:hypothetical protein
MEDGGWSTEEDRGWEEVETNHNHPVNHKAKSKKHKNNKIPNF